MDEPVLSLAEDAAMLALDAQTVIGIRLAQRGIAQVSTNVEDHRQTKLSDVVEAVRRHASVTRAELVGLAPRAAFDQFPDDVSVDNKRLIEDALTAVPDTH